MHKILLVITLIVFLLCFYGEGFAAARVTSPNVPATVTDPPATIKCATVPAGFTAKYGNNNCLACTTNGTATTNAASKYSGKPIYCMPTIIPSTKA